MSDDFGPPRTEHGPAPRFVLTLAEIEKLKADARGNERRRVVTELAKESCEYCADSKNWKPVAPVEHSIYFKHEYARADGIWNTCSCGWLWRWLTEQERNETAPV